MHALRVIADDLTGACDVAAALLPWPGGVTVYTDGLGDPVGEALAVRNTQTRTLSPEYAARRVRRTLAVAAGGSAGVLLKKIDTGLRGPLGAEIDAALDALGAARAFVLPAIPEVGRTTVGGEQRIDGIPVHRTAFADDPHTPVRDARVAAVIEATARRAAASVGLDAVRRPGGVRDALARCRAPIVVFDAETDADLAGSVEALLEEPRPLVLVGSIGLARALRASWPLARVPDAVTLPAAPRAGGVLVVVGSAHPAAHGQREHARAAGALAAVVEVSPLHGEPAGRVAARHLVRGESVALTAPGTVAPGAEGRIAGALRAAVVAALDMARPAGLLLVGGETAYHVFAGLGHPALNVHSRPVPLAVHGRIASGPHRDLPVVTKGGSSGAPDLIAELVRRLAEGDW